MPRIQRGLQDNFIYHMINRGNGRLEIFHKDEDYSVFIELLKVAKGRYPVKIFGYCLMPNHFHIVVKPERGEELSKWMQWLMTSHVRRYHKHYGSSGHVWQGRFKSFMIQNDAHLLMVLRYIEGNPVRAQLVSSAKEWIWSSHGERTGEKRQILIDDIPMELPGDWERYLNEPLTGKELEKIRQSANRQSPYGDSEWQAKVCKEFGLESTLREKGRPKKKKEG
jgi:putative transposase